MSLDFAPRSRRLTADEVVYIGQKRARGFPDPAIARMMGRSVEQVRAISAYKPKPPKQPPRLPGPPGMVEIVEAVARQYGMTAADLVGRSKDGDLTDPRNEAYAALYATGRFSTTKIGQFFDGRDHSSIAKGLKAHASRLAAREAAE